MLIDYLFFFKITNILDWVQLDYTVADILRNDERFLAGLVFLLKITL